MIPPPEVNRNVHVVTDEVEGVLQSRVEDVKPGRLSLAYPSDGNNEFRLPVSSKVTIEWLARRGICSIEGVVTGHANLGVPTLTVALVSDPVLNQRRDYARADLVLDVEVWPSADCEEPLTGVTLDVSGGGLRAVLGSPLNDGDVVRASIDMPDGAPLSGLVRVVEQREDCVALEFYEISEFERERLIREVFASQSRDAALRRPPA